jgi:hypothetical protein
MNETNETVHQPLQILRYRLTLVDALAYERLPGEWSGRRKIAALAPLIAIGAFSGMIEDWPRLWWWASVGGLVLLWVVAGLSVHNWQIHRRARTMAVREGQTEIEEWGDHLVIRSQSGIRHLAYEQIGKVISTDSHVFILFHGGPAIVPLRAFEDAAEMRAFADALDRRSEEAVM